MSHNMTILTTLTLAIIFGYFLCQSTALPTPDEDRYMDKEYNRELINWILTYQNPQHLVNICKYISGSMLGGQLSKRNSELINSLLSLPKNMNDAGK